MRLKTLRTYFIRMILLLVVILTGCKESSVTISNLTCEYLADLLGFEEMNPRLCWNLQSDERGQKQTTYHLIVAGSLNLLDKNEGDIWDPGKVQSGQSVQVE